MFALIDHYDSFTYNVVHLIKETSPEKEIRVFRSDEFTIDDLEKLPLEMLFLSPGPGRPEEYPMSLEAIRHFSGRIPIFGICLGHQQIGLVFGGKIIHAKRVMHGKTDDLLLDGRGCFRTITNPLTAMRYHSLAVDEALPNCLEMTAQSRDGQLMGIRHKTHTIEGIQFHPESIGTEQGKKIIQNFLNYRRDPFPAKAVLSKLLAGQNLDKETAHAFMLETAEGNLSDSQLAGFLCAMEAKGVTADELAGCVAVLREKRKTFHKAKPSLDIVGVGGDNIGSFNLSSMAALVAAACGVSITKHGNRAVSSLCGAADFFAELGYPLDIPINKAEQLQRETNFAFLFAPMYHSAMRFAAGARKALSVRTIMNLLGPLANPADAEYQVLGVPDIRLARPMAEAALMLGGQRVLVVISDDGLDEFSVASPTRGVWGMKNKAIQDFYFDPKEAGISPADSKVLKGGSAEVNATMARKLMEGDPMGGLMDAVCLNAGSGLFAANVCDSVIDGYRIAKASFLDSSVKKKTAEIIDRARELKTE